MSKKRKLTEEEVKKNEEIIVKCIKEVTKAKSNVLQVGIIFDDNDLKSFVSDEEFFGAQAKMLEMLEECMIVLCEYLTGGVNLLTNKNMESLV